MCALCNIDKGLYCMHVEMHGVVVVMSKLCIALLYWLCSMCMHVKPMCTCVREVVCLRAAQVDRLEEEVSSLKAKLAGLRNQCQSLKQEVTLTQKVRFKG